MESDIVDTGNQIGKKNWIRKRKMEKYVEYEKKKIRKLEMSAAWLQSY